MATLKFEVGKVYITMADKFGDGEQTGKSVVIERTEGTVTFKHLASGEIFVREVEVFDTVQVEGCDGLDAMDNFIADNFGEEITTADIETVEPVAEVETVENTAEVEPVENTAMFEVGKWYYNVFDRQKTPAYKVLKRAKKSVTLVDTDGEIFRRKFDTDLGVESIYNGEFECLEGTAFCTDIAKIKKAEDELAYSLAQAANEEQAQSTYFAESVEVDIAPDDTAETEQAKVEVCKAYDAKDIIAACYPVDIAKIDAEEKSDAVDVAVDDTVEIEKAIYDKFHKIFGYKELIIGLEGDIAKMEKLNELYAEEREMRLANGYPADGMELLTAENDEIIGKRKAKIAEYQQKLEALKAEFESLKNKLVALKISKVAA